MMSHKRPYALALVVMASLLTACGIIEPKESEPNPNQPPTVVLTAYPPDVAKHVVTFHWKGQDMDGIVLGYDVSVDGSPWVTTTATETTLVLSAVDNGLHSFAVRAFDDRGGYSEPARRTFTATSIAPETRLKVAPNPGARIGPAVTIELDAEDPDDASFQWRCRIDDGPWSEWRSDSTFSFADPSIVAGAFPVLSQGVHTFFGQAKDAGGVIDDTPVSVTFEVIAGTEPRTTVNLCEINGRVSYADYSAFTAENNKNLVHFEVSSDVSWYSGVLAGFSYIWTPEQDLGSAQFSAWTNATNFDFRDVSPGKYWFIIRARDTAGHVESAPESIFVDIVNPRTDLNPSSIVVIQETRNGTGARGSPTVAQVNEYYQAMLGARPYTLVNYAELAARNWYVSPRVAGRAGLIIWIDDDSSDHWLFSHPENMRFLREYVQLKSRYGLDRPTHLFLSHWNLMGASNVDMAFLGQVFGLTDASTNGNTRDFVASRGVGQLADVTLTVDPDKLPSAFAGKLNKVWTCEGPAGHVALTQWQGDPPGTLDGRTNAYYAAGSDAEVVVLGYPLYFMRNAPTFMERALQLLGF